MSISITAMEQDPEHIITEGTEQQTIDLLHSGYNYSIPVTYKEKTLPLFYIAVMRGQLKVIQYLHEQLGIDLYTECDSPFWLGWPPLHIAIYFNQPSVIRYYCSPKILQELKTKNIDMNTPMPSGGMPGYAPIHTAAAVGAAEAIRLLHAASADINALTKGPALAGISALCLAILHSKVDNIKTLVSLGAQLVNVESQCDQYVDTSAAFQLHKKYLQEIAPLTQQLIKQCQRLNGLCKKSELTQACQRINQLLATGAEADVIDAQGLSPLHRCIQFYEPSMPSLADRCALNLIRHGANPNIVDLNGLTPLGRACLYNNQRLISLFLRHGADPARGINAVSIAVARNNGQLMQQFFDLAGSKGKQEALPGTTLERPAKRQRSTGGEL